MPHFTPPLEATERRFGRLRTDRTEYEPLDTVTLTITGRDPAATSDGRGDTRCSVRVADSNLGTYFEAEVELVENTGTVSFAAAGALGVQWAYLYFPDREKHQRYENFVVDAETKVVTGNPDYDDIYPITRDALALSRRDFATDDGRFVGYISGDTWAIDGVWLRDWIYHMPAYANWEREMTCGLDRFLSRQREDGMIPDGIRRDGTTWRAAVESDVEYILVLGVWDTWRATGDNEWMAQALPKVEKALEYVRTDEERWDDEHKLVKRGHTCDTWDFSRSAKASQFSGKRVRRGNVRPELATTWHSVAMAEMHAGAGKRRR